MRLLFMATVLGICLTSCENLDPGAESKKLCQCYKAAGFDQIEVIKCQVLAEEIGKKYAGKTERQLAFIDSIKANCAIIYNQK